jgi:hypothetical protein
MNHEKLHLLELADRVAQGEPGAALAFRQEFEPWTYWNARRALRPGAPSTPKTRRFQAEAESVRLLSGDVALEEDALAEAVARRFCDRAIDRLQHHSGVASPWLETLVG